MTGKKQLLHLHYEATTYLYIIAVPILFGFALRSIEVVTQNFVFGYDQGLDMMAAKSIWVDHKLTLVGSEAGAGFAGLPYLFHGPGYHYLLAFVGFVSNGDPYGSIVLMYITSLVEVMILICIGTLAFGKKGGLIVLFISAISPFLAAHGRMLWAPNAAGIVATLFLYLLYILERRRPSIIFLTAFLAASLYNFELPFAIPVVLGVTIYTMWFLKMRSIKELALLISGYILGFFPLIAFQIRHGASVAGGLTSYVTRTQDNPFSPFAEFVGDGNAFLHHFFETVLTPTVGVGWVFLLYLIYGVVRAYKRKKLVSTKRYIVTLLCILGANFLVYYVYRGPVYPHYLSLLTYIYVLLFGFVISSSLSKRGYERVMGFCVLFLLAVTFLLRYYPVIVSDWVDYGGTAKIVGKKNALDTIFEDASGKPFNLLVFTPPVYTYPYDYLVWWYGSRKYGYMPGKEKSGIFYLLIEPDPSKPWSYQGWLETVIKTGTVEKTWKLPSGFIIEKRVEMNP